MSNHGAPDLAGPAAGVAGAERSAIFAALAQTSVAPGGGYGDERYQRVPEDLAVLGVDNDELLCNYSAVPLSSVDRNLEQIGFESARLLDRLIKKEAASDEVVAVPPAALVVRRSTAALAINDPDAAAAVRFIAERGCGDIDVDDVLAAVPVSRRALERKLRKAIGRTPAQEIRRVRLARVCELLTDTDLPLSDIVPRTGFQYRTYLARAFKKEFGQTPRQFRKRNRPLRM